MMRIQMPLILGLALFTYFNLSKSAEAAIVQDWQFDDPAGTPLSGAANTGTIGSSFQDNFDNSFTTGTGTYSLVRPVSGPIQSISVPP